jgi:VanZ family protein
LYILIAGGVILIYSLTPFDFYYYFLDFGVWVDGAIERSLDDGLPKMIGHFTAFFILGVLVGAENKRLTEGRGFRRFAVVSILACLGLEIFQLVLSSRHARLTDLFFNTSGVLAGAKSVLLSHQLRFLRKPAGVRHRIGGEVAVLVVAAGLWVAAGLQPALGALRMDWDRDFQLMIGNEPDGGRPWLGQIGFLGIYGRALTDEQVSILCRKTELGQEDGYRKDLGLLVLYDLTRGKGNEVPSRGSIQSDNLTLQVSEGTRWLGNAGGISLERPSLLLSRGEASELTDAIMSSGVFSIEVWMRAGNVDRANLGRIVSLSDGIWTRNFTLAQDGGGLVFRVRNRINGSNGSRNELEVRNVIHNSWQHVVAVYDHGFSAIFIDGGLSGPIADLRETPVCILLGTSPAGRAAAGVLLVMAVTLPGYSMLSFIRQDAFRHFTIIILTLCVGVLPYSLSTYIVGGPWRFDLFLWLGVALLVVYPLGFIFVHRREEMKS